MHYRLKASLTVILSFGKPYPIHAEWLVFLGLSELFKIKRKEEALHSCLKAAEGLKKSKRKRKVMEKVMEILLLSGERRRKYIYIYRFGQH